jgi:N-6 DNA Methylase
MVGGRKKEVTLSSRKSPAWAHFIRLFQEIGSHRHRYEVFRDFVTLSAIAVHNAVGKDDQLEAEYMSIIGRYKRDDVDRFPRLLGHLVELLDPEPWDALGQLYMELELSSAHAGQFFTPPAVSELMARIVASDLLAKLADLERPFITVSEPACGAGGMVLSFVKVLLEHQHDPAQKLWVQCHDVDRLAALMCYLQLSLWNVPGDIIVGDTLTLERREAFYTPAHTLGGWSMRLAARDASGRMMAITQTAQERPPVAPSISGPKPFAVAHGNQQQFDFDF